MSTQLSKTAEVRGLLAQLNQAQQASLIKGYYIHSNWPVSSRHILHIYLLEHNGGVELRARLMKHIEETYTKSVITVNGSPHTINVYLDAEL